MLRTNRKMQGKLLLVACLLIIQACVPIVAQTLSPDESESSGYLQQAREAYRAAKDKAHVIGETVLGFAGAYYEDHVKPVADHYPPETCFTGICTPTSTGEMNGKLALAFVLALQVSVSLCQIPVPDKELVEKYEGMKSVFYKRLNNAYNKVQAAVGPLTENAGQSQAVKDYVEELQGNPHFQSVVKISTGLAQEAVPVIDKIRSAGLGLYGAYLRPHIGTYLDEAITHAKVYLDQVLPTEN
ncbi:hypothetical protein UPYG_G00152150 [Umbra pygmaea]|uniref:Apolipoprotein A-II n=1 Tax=Umbra pygmaea TaxID=75934 RepID=A0ABD0X1P1_UMBPY